MSRSKRRERGPRKGRPGATGAGPRLRESEHAVPGERAVIELLRGQPERVRRLLLEEQREMPEVTTLADALGVAVTRVERDLLEALVGPGVARGVLAVADPPTEWDFEDLLAREDGPRTRRGHHLLVICDGIVDPHNLGAVIRSAEFFGAAGVVWARDRSAPLSAVAVRSSAGASERIALSRVTNLARALEGAKQQGDWWVVGTVVDDGQALRNFAGDPPTNMILVLGSEQRGLRRLTRERCDFLVRIEGAGSLGSLNVSAAAAVALAWLS